MRVKEVPIGDVRPYEDNPRDNEGAVSAVAASIREFGFQQPIVVDADGTVIAGHTRLKAAQALGMKTVPVVVASGLTPEQVAAYRLADNKTGELASWDAELLAEQLDGISVLDMGQFGFTDADFPGEMAAIDADEVGGLESRLFYLETDGKKWPITEAESGMLKRAMGRWVESEGLTYGFVSSLLGDEDGQGVGAEAGAV